MSRQHDRMIPLWLLPLVTVSAALGPPSEASAAPLSVAYEVRARTVTWIPIRLNDLAEGIGSQVVGELARGDLMRLRKLPRLRPGTRRPALAEDMLLLIEGDVVEDAGNFTVVVSLRPLRDSGLPSFVTAATVSISGKPRRVMYTRITGAAREAARRMRGTLEARRGALTGGAAEATPVQPFDWGKLVPPRGKLRGDRDLTTFSNGRLSWHKRKQAGFRLAGRAFDDENVRHAIERVALTDPEPLTRLYALKFLEPCSRVYPFTQRVILAVAREESDPKVKREAVDLSRHFVGLSPHQTLQTWVQLLSATVAELDRRTHGEVAKLLQERQQTPNLDLGLLACLVRQEVMREGRDRKRACLKVLEKLPLRRRSAVLMAYINRPLADLEADMPERYDHGPVGKAVRLAFLDPCRQPMLRRVLWRILDEGPPPRVAANLLDVLAKNQVTARVITTSARYLGEASDHRIRSTLTGIMEQPGHCRVPDYGVLSWSAGREALGAALASGQLASHEQRNFKSSLLRLKKCQGEKYKLALASQMQPDQPPGAGAAAHFARCLLDNLKDRRLARDCLSGFKWLLKKWPQRRREAVAVLQGLLTQERQELPHPLRRRVESMLKDVAWRYKRAREGGEEVVLCPLP